RLFVEACLPYAGAVARRPYRYAKTCSRLPVAVFDLGTDEATAVARQALVERAARFDASKASMATWAVQTCCFAICNEARRQRAERRGGGRRFVGLRDVTPGREDDPVQAAIFRESAELLLR